MRTPSIFDVNKVTSLMATEINKAILSHMEQQPNIKVLNLDGMTIEDVKEYIRSKHSTEWARRSVFPDDNLEDAAEWFMAELRDLYGFLAHNHLAQL